MDCRDCNKLLPLYMDVCLKPSQMSKIQAHLDVCSACREESQLYFRAVNLVGALKEIDVPGDFHERLMFRLEKTYSNRPTRVWNSLVFASAGVAATFLFAFLFFRPLPEWISAGWTDSSFQVQNQRPDSQKSLDQLAAKPVIPSSPLTEVLSLSAMVPPKSNSIQQPLEDTLPQQIIVGERFPTPNVALSLGETLSINPLLQTVSTQSADFSPARPALSANPVERVVPSVPLLRQGREWAGEVCAISSPWSTAVGTQGDLDALWLKAGIRSTAKPEIDWNQQMLGAIFLGTRSGQGYEIELRDSTEESGEFIQRYHVSAASPASAVKTTRPFILFSMPRTSLPVHFLEE